jgi:hypothetical protein
MAIVSCGAFAVCDCYAVLLLIWCLWSCLLRLCQLVSVAFYYLWQFGLAVVYLVMLLLLLLLLYQHILAICYLDCRCLVYWYQWSGVDPLLLVMVCAVLWDRCWNCALLLGLRYEPCNLITGLTSAELDWNVGPFDWIVGWVRCMVKIGRFL